MKKRTFEVVRKILLKRLLKKDMTINELGKISSVNWKTTERHLVYLCGKGFVKEILFTSYVKIYGITERGKEFLKNEK